eukprot:CAMPEP_0178387432 /NCGR_PEP_ID=MMETSP0689_2-20121128/9071_1 /TAXON_ID=160604 /ORGANISM="Amphidinium massartii, Strain CS-259" /LENGTH=484 /DNA_ID=CAMNT_0020007797 /DNA_START=793 /DNA_END=2247 /DNA_ORIENTATION=-
MQRSTSWCLRNIAQLCGLTMIIAACLLFDGTTPFPSYFALVPCFGTAFVIAAADPAEDKSLPVSRLLSLPWLVYIGEMSYSVYLWHWPVFVFICSFARDMVSIWHKLLGVGASLVIGAASLQFIERVFRNRKQRSEKRFWSLLGIGWFGLIALYRYYASLWAHTKYAITVDIKHTQLTFGGNGSCVSLHTTNAVHWSNVTLQTVSLIPDDFPQPNHGFEKHPDWLHPHIFHPDLQTQRGPSIAMIGSSHCEMYMGMVGSLGQRYHKSVGVLCANRRMVRFPGFEQEHCRRPFDKSRLTFLAAWSPEVIVWADLWHLYMGLSRISCSWNTTDLSAFFDYNFRLLLAHAKRLVIFGDNPWIAGAPKTSLQNRAVFLFRRVGNFDFLRYKQDAIRYKQIRIFVEDVIQASVRKLKHDIGGERIDFVPVAHLFRGADLHNTTVLIVDPDTYQIMYKDSNHLNALGAVRVEPFFAVYVFGELACQSYDR